MITFYIKFILIISENYKIANNGLIGILDVF